MKPAKLQETIKAVLGNDDIAKEGLVMMYVLDKTTHEKLEEHIFFTNNPEAKKKDFKPGERFEIDVEEFSICFVKEDDKIVKKILGN